MQRKKLFVTFVRFGIVGVLATALHYGFYYLLHFVMGANAAFTFGTSPSWRKLFGMSGAYAFNYLLQIGLLNFFLCMGVDKVWAPFPVYAIAVPVNFILVRFVFTSKNE